MGMDIRAAIFVGLRRQDIEMDRDELQEMIEEGTLEVAPPFYDGNSDGAAVVGLEVAGSSCYNAQEFDWDSEEVYRLQQEFTELTGQEGKMFITPYVY